MHKAFKYRIYPNKTQEIQLSKTFGSCRFYWNNLVASFNSYNKETNPNPVFKTQKELKLEYAWLGEVSAATLQEKFRDFQEFKNQLFSKTRVNKIGRPKFKKKGGRQSFRLPNQKFSLSGDKIRLEKIGHVKIIIDRLIPENSKLLSVTVSKNSSGQYFASIAVELEIKPKQKTGLSVGVDLGLKEFATLSDGIIIGNQRFFRESQSKLRKVQKIYSRKKKGSSRQKKCKLMIARVHRDIANQRNYFLHNTTTFLVNNYDSIYIEDLNVSGMLKNHKLAKSISDVSWSEFRRMIEYKAKWYGKSIHVIGRFEASSKTCSCCGWKNDSLTLKDRIFNCESCGLSLDRDLNAAINIKAFGVANAIRTQSGEVTNRVEVFRVE
ncbi:MAG: RNA-guided endonuclease TnpB family protein [Sphaerospermopsis sp.]|nr:RNA-guided endonuclease TnpB family protein [Sphaerospermopsis sp.]